MDQDGFGVGGGIGIRVFAIQRITDNQLGELCLKFDGHLLFLPGTE